jgi:hypothetical protein
MFSALLIKASPFTNGSVPDFLPAVPQNTGIDVGTHYTLKAIISYLWRLSAANTNAQ